MICRADARLLRQVDTDVSRELWLPTCPGAPGRLVAPVRFQPRQELPERPFRETSSRRSRPAFGSTTQWVERRTHDEDGLTWAHWWSVNVSMGRSGPECEHGHMMWRRGSHLWR